MDVKDRLAKEIESLISALGDAEAASDEYNKITNDLSKLVDKYNEMNRNDYDYWGKREDREKDYELREKQMADDRKDRKIKNGLTAASIFGGFGLTIWGTLKSLKFEETGSVTTNAGREFIKKLFHMK